MCTLPQRGAAERGRRSAPVGSQCQAPPQAGPLPAPALVPGGWQGSVLCSPSYSKKKNVA